MRLSDGSDAPLHEAHFFEPPLPSNPAPSRRLLVSSPERQEGATPPYSTHFPSRDSSTTLAAVTVAKESKDARVRAPRLPLPRAAKTKTKDKLKTNALPKVKEKTASQATAKTKNRAKRE